jgi:hypothetical protein
MPHTPILQIVFLFVDPVLVAWGDGPQTAWPLQFEEKEEGEKRKEIGKERSKKGKEEVNYLVCCTYRKHVMIDI